MSNVELIPVSKGDEYIEVHPVALRAHEQLGWRKCARQEPIEHEDSEGVKKATVAELRAQLEAAGIPIPEGAKKADLVALLPAA